jgi:hypothetical protein
MKFTFDEEIDAANMENSLDAFVPTEEDRQWNTEDSNSKDDLHQKWVRYYLSLGRIDGYSGHNESVSRNCEFYGFYRIGYFMGQNEMELRLAKRCCR